MTIIRWLLAALATWRVAQFVVLDDGPADVMFRARREAGRYSLRPSAENPNYTEPATAVGRMLDCVHCVGKWVAIPMAVLAVWPSRGGDVVLGVLGLAGAQSLIEGRRDSHKLIRPVKMRMQGGGE